jgi:hypothetical protein
LVLVEVFGVSPHLFLAIDHGVQGLVYGMNLVDSSLEIRLADSTGMVGAKEVAPARQDDEGHD